MRDLPRLTEPGGDIDLADPSASAYNRAACGLLDIPAERELTGVDVLAVVAAENVVVQELDWLLTIEWLTLYRWLDGD